MIVRISNRLYTLSTGPVALVTLVIFTLFTALVLPAQAEEAAARSGEAGSPDSSFFYTPSDLYRFAEAYGPDGRVAYVEARFTFDLIWPLVYAAFLAACVSWLFARAFPPGSAWRLANLVPLLGLLFDYLENLSTSLVMVRYPAATPVIDWLAPVLTLVKWVFVNGSFILLLVGVAALVWRWARRRGNRDG